MVVKDNSIVKAEFEKRHIVCIDKTSMFEIPRQPKRATFRQKLNKLLIGNSLSRIDKNYSLLEKMSADLAVHSNTKSNKRMSESRV